MNKLIKKITILVIMLFCFTLTACGDDISSTPRIVITKEYALRTTVDIEYTIFDIDENLVSLKCEITTPDYKSGDDNYYSSTRTVSMYGGSFEEDEDGEELPGGDFIGEEKTITFSGLETGVKYKVAFTGTYGGKAYVLTSTTLTTDEVGGTEENPHIITTFEELKTVENDKDGYFILENDIDCDGGIIEPFFTSSKKFIGDFDGNNKTISNFTQSNFELNQGVFGYIGEGGTVYDLTVENFDITASRTSSQVNVAGFAGTNEGSISNVHVKDVVLNTLSKKIPQYVGGFVAINSMTGSIENCSVTNAHLNMESPRTAIAGGFVAWNQQNGAVPTITDCSAINVLIDVRVTANPDFDSNSDDIDVDMQIGGFVGNNGGTISSSIATSKILVYVENTLTDLANNEYDDDKDVEESLRHVKIDKYKVYLGGFAGYNTGFISDSAVNVSLDFENAFTTQLEVGGFIGYNAQHGTVNNSVFIPGDFYLTINEKTMIDDGESFIGFICGYNDGSAVNAYYKDSFEFIISERVDTKVETTVDDVTTVTYEYAFNDVTLSITEGTNFGSSYFTTELNALYALIAIPYAA